MVKRTSAPFLDFLYEALSSRFGLVVSTNQPEALRQALYKARRDAADPQLSKLSLRISPVSPSDEVWIVKDDQKS